MSDKEKDNYEGAGAILWPAICLAFWIATGLILRFYLMNV